MGPRFVRLRPEQGGQVLAARRPVADRKVGEESGRLARVDDERCSVDLDPHGAEELEAEAGRHGDTVQGRSRVP